jgi:hypothetical protein
MSTNIATSPGVVTTSAICAASSATAKGSTQSERACGENQTRGAHSASIAAASATKVVTAGAESGVSTRERPGAPGRRQWGRASRNRNSATNVSRRSAAFLLCPASG